MQKSDIPHEAIVLVCANARSMGERMSCAGEGCEGQRLLIRLKELVKEKGMEKRIRVSKSGCLDRCEEGPVVLVVPRDGPPQCFTKVSLGDADDLGPFLKTQP
jgi:predicted metal-binding protein